MSNSQQSGRTLIFAQRIWPTSKKKKKNESYILESSLLFSFVLDICVLICVWLLTKEPHITVNTVISGYHVRRSPVSTLLVEP